MVGGLNCAGWNVRWSFLGSCVVLLVAAACGGDADGTAGASAGTHGTDTDCGCPSSGAESMSASSPGSSGADGDSTEDSGCASSCETGVEPPAQCSDALPPGGALWADAAPIFGLPSSPAVRSSFPSGFRDINGDGFDDVVLRDGTPSGSGVLVLFGPFDPGDLDAPAWVDRGGGFRIEPSGSLLGNAEIVGDMNGDGLADIGVGAVSEDGCSCGRDDGCFGTVTSSVYIVRGKADSGAVALEDLDAGEGGFAVHGVPIDGAPCGFAGAFISPLGDVDGDGLADVWLANEGQPGLLRGTAVDATVADSELERDVEIRGPAGDIDVDGIADFVTLGAAGSGTLVVRLGGPDLVAASAAFSFDAVAVVLSAGDVDGDGMPDLAVGPIDNTVFVVFGRTDGAMVSQQQIEAGDGGFAIEYTDEGQVVLIAAPGDFDGDGLADVGVTVPYDHITRPTGRIFVVSGKVDGSTVLLGTEAGPGVALFEREDICAGPWGNTTVAPGDLYAEGRGVLLNSYSGGSVVLRHPD